MRYTRGQRCCPKQLNDGTPTAAQRTSRMTIHTKQLGNGDVRSLLSDERAHDASMMEVALAEAEKARGATSPNPLVGAALVDETAFPPRLLATGFHAAAGRAHAEVDALAKLAEQGGDATGKTLYVTLEPCNHVGRTGKCTEALLRAGVRRVVIGMHDPNPQVAGGGADRLRREGLDVVCGVCEDACRFQNRGYLRFLQSGRPHVVLKAAISLDGRLAVGHSPSLPKAPQWLTGELSRRKAHELRSFCDAIVVGAGTVLCDDPLLTVRLGDRRETKQRVVIDGALRVGTDARVVGPGTLIFTSEQSAATKKDLVSALSDRGVSVLAIPPASTKTGRRGSETDIDLGLAMTVLGQRGVLYAICEGGGVLHGAMLEANLYDEAALFVAPLFLGDEGVPLLRNVACASVSEATFIDRPVFDRLGADWFVTGALRRGGFSPSTSVPGMT